MCGFSKCFNARYGARIVAILNFWICMILMIQCISLLTPYYNDYFKTFSDYDLRTQISDDITIFIYLFQIFVFLYINYYLKDSTYDRKIYKIHQWLAINVILLSFYILAIVYVMIKSNYHELFYYSIPVCFVHSCQIYVVKIFYDQELERSLRTMSAHSNAAIISHFVSNGSVNVALNNPPPPVPNSQVYPVQGAQQLDVGPPCDHHPSAIYPHIGRNSAEPSSERCPPLEYYNPPAYSPCYEPQNVRN